MTANAQDNVRYLTSLQYFSHSHLKGISSGLTSAFNLIHLAEGGLANDIFAQGFFKSVKNMKLGILRKHCEVWDPTVIVTFIQENWEKNDNLSLGTLQKQAAILLCLGAMWRPCLDLGKLQWRDIDSILQDDTNRPFC